MLHIAMAVKAVDAISQALAFVYEIQTLSVLPRQILAMLIIY